MSERDDLWAIETIQHFELGIQALKRAQADPESILDKRAVSIAITQAETAMLWVANARP